MLAAGTGFVVGCCVHIRNWNKCVRVCGARAISIFCRAGRSETNVVIRREAKRTWKATCTGLFLTIVGGVSLDAWACSEAASFDLAADAAVGLGFYVLVDVVCVLAVFAVPGVARVAWQMCQDTETHRGCVVSARQCRRKCCRRRYDGSAAERLPLPGGPREARRKK